MLVAATGAGYALSFVRRRILPFAVRAAALALVLLVPGRAAVAAADAYGIKYQGGKLWLNARGVPAADLLKALAQKTGVRFVVDSDINPGPITLTLDGMPLERAVRNLVSAIPQAKGHTMTYASAKKGGPRLVQVSLFSAGKATAGKGAAVYGDGAEPPVAEVDARLPLTLPTPNLDDRMEKMIDAGVPRETAEKVITLTREVQKLQKTPAPGTYSPGDLSPESREKLDPLVQRGVPMERAVQMLLLQERYQATLKDLQGIPASAVPQPPAP